MGGESVSSRSSDLSSSELEDVSCSKEESKDRSAPALIGTPAPDTGT